MKIKPSTHPIIPSVDRRPVAEPFASDSYFSRQEVGDDRTPGLAQVLEATRPDSCKSTLEVLKRRWGDPAVFIHDGEVSYPKKGTYKLEQPERASKVFQLRPKFPAGLYGAELTVIGVNRPTWAPGPETVSFDLPAKYYQEHFSDKLSHVLFNRSHQVTGEAPALVRSMVERGEGVAELDQILRGYVMPDDHHQTTWNEKVVAQPSFFKDMNALEDYIGMWSRLRDDRVANGTHPKPSRPIVSGDRLAAGIIDAEPSLERVPGYSRERLAGALLKLCGEFSSITRAHPEFFRNSGRQERKPLR